MSPRTGRPVIGEPKTNDIKVRLDDTTHKKLLEYCKGNSTTKAEVIRKDIKQFLGLRFNIWHLIFNMIYLILQQGGILDVRRKRSLY